MPSRSKLTVLAIAGAVLLAALPAPAEASKYLSRSKATKITKTFALRYIEQRYSRNRTACWPTGQRHTSRNLRFAWTSWDCKWSIRRHDDPDGSVDLCAGKIRVVGKRGGSKRRTLQRARCVQISGPTENSADTGNGPSPGPSPNPGTSLSTRHKQMIDYAINDARTYGNQLIALGDLSGSGQYYWWHIDPRECEFLNNTKVSCPMYVWFEAHDWGNNGPGLEFQITREIFRSWVFVEDLGTAVGFNRNIEPQGATAYEPNQPYYMICSNRYTGPPVCPASWNPVIYPPGGPPWPA